MEAEGTSWKEFNWRARGVASRSLSAEAVGGGSAIAQTSAQQKQRQNSTVNRKGNTRARRAAERATVFAKEISEK